MDAVTQNNDDRSMSEHLSTIRLLAKTRDFEGILELLKPLREQHPKHPELLIWQARAHLHLRRVDHAKETVAEGDRHGLSMPAWLYVKIRLALATDLRHEAVAIGRVLCAREAFPLNNLGGLLLDNAQRLEDWHSLRLFAQKVLANDKNDRNALRHFYEAEIQIARETIVLDDIETMVFQRDGHPDHLVAIELFCTILCKRPQDVHPLIEQAKQRWPDAEQIDHLTQKLDAFFDLSNPPFPASALGGWVPSDIPESAQHTHAIEGMANKPVQISPIRPSNTLLLTCLHSHKAIVLFDRYAAALGCTAVYPVDPDGYYCSTGLAGFATGYTETVTKLDTLLRTIGPDHRLAIIGSSGGALAALNFAVDLAPERLVLFGPATCADPAFQVEIGDKRRPATLEKMARRVPLDFRKPMNRLRHSPPKRTKLIYAGNNSIDEKHAALLNDLPNLNVKAQADVTQHNIAGYLARKGKMLSFLQGALFDQAEGSLQT